jgi:hypothetical protein
VSAQAARRSSKVSEKVLPALPVGAVNTAQHSAE